MLKLSGELTIYRAHELKDQLVQALQAGAAEVDLSAVTEVDTAGVQLLILAKREAAARGAALHFVGHSPAVLDVMDLLDLAGHFGDAVVMPGAAA